MERRFTAPALAPVKVEARADGKRTITGYGAVFYNASDPGTEYRLWADVYERIMPGAFDRAIREDDCRSCFNHDPNIVLGRGRAGTLKLSVDAKGLRYETAPPDTQLVRDQVLSPIERGDVTGSSFMFVVRKAKWNEETRDEKDVMIREIEEVELWEVGPVVFPAYESTTTGVRGGEDGEARESLRLWREQRAASEAEAITVRAREIAIDTAG